MSLPLPEFIKKAISRKAINEISSSVPPRPRPFSMAAPYTTWNGLKDKEFSARHLPFASEEYTAGLPPVEDVLPLFKREEEMKSPTTSMLFPFFAQWFTDSFCRTKYQDFARNESNHDIDLNQIYGMSETQTTMLRSKSGGRLKSQMIDGEEYPASLFEESDGELKLKEEFDGLYTSVNFARVFENASEEHKKNAFAVGLEHGNSTIGNTVLNVLFHREHNRVAGVIADAHKDWDDERVFQTARNVCIVELLKIVVEDYITHIAGGKIQFYLETGFAEKENWYRENWIAVEFNLLYRFHDLIPDDVTFGGQTRPGEELRQNIQWIKEVGLDKIVVDASAQPCGRMGLKNTPEFLMGVRLASLKMARECALPSFNEYRKRFGLKPYRNFLELTGRDLCLSAELKRLYGDVDNLEFFVGIWAEAYNDKFTIMGELMVLLVGYDAFTQIFTNPLVAEAVYNADTFSKEGLLIIEDTMKLADIIARNTGVTDKGSIGFKTVVSK